MLKQGISVRHRCLAVNGFSEARLETPTTTGRPARNPVRPLRLRRQLDVGVSEDFDEVIGQGLLAFHVRR